VREALAASSGGNKSARGAGAGHLTRSELYTLLKQMGQSAQSL
jgi:hypothetical protein